MTATTQERGCSDKGKKGTTSIASEVVPFCFSTLGAMAETQYLEDGSPIIFSEWSDKPMMVDRLRTLAGECPVCGDPHTNCKPDGHGGVINGTEEHRQQTLGRLRPLK